MRLSFALSICFLLAASIVPPATLFAQSQANTGAIEGIVMDPSGRAVPKAQVSIVNLGTNFTRDLVTDDEGRFRGLLLPLVLCTHGPRAGQARAAISELRPEVPAERALEEFAAGLGLAASNDDPGIRAGLIELTREVGGHPAMRPGRVQQETLRQLRELLAAPGR